ncbi:MAG: cytochrome c4 [Gammaproteobacteria bacterium]|nr:cytochrome c4 [Gammaproteobacteria bacterium]
MNSIIRNATLVLGLIAMAPFTQAAGDAQAGQAKATACAACHNTDGNSLASTFPKIAGLGEKYLYKQLRDIKDGERSVPEMTGQLDHFNDQDLADIAAFFAAQSIQLSGSEAFSVMLNNGDNVDGLMLGRKIFRSGNKESGVPACMGCHSPTGKGNEPAGYPRLSGQYAQYIEKQLTAFREGSRANDGVNRTMRTVAKQLSNAEIKALANYVAGLTDAGSESK